MTTRFYMRMTAGDSELIHVEVRDQDGAALNVSQADFEYVIAASVNSTALVTKMRSVGIEPGSSTNIFEITLDPADTAALAGTYYHEAQVILGLLKYTAFSGVLVVDDSQL